MPNESPALSIIDIERLLDTGKDKLLGLAQRREELVQEIAEIDQAMLRLVDLRGMRGRPRKKRPANAAPLRTVLLEILKKHKKGFTLPELAATITESGYRSNSVKFSNIVYQTIYHTPEVEIDQKTGCYRLKK